MSLLDFKARRNILMFLQKSYSLKHSIIKKEQDDEETNLFDHS